MIGGESAYAHAIDAGVASRVNSYVVTIQTRRANPTAPGSGRPATIQAVAECSETGVPVLPIAPYARR
jgi:hypothetical protein